MRNLFDRQRPKFRWFAAGMLLAVAGLSEPVRAIGDGPHSRPLLLAHYMPWYVAKPSSPDWGWHWTMNHFDPEQKVAGHPQIASHYTPVIGAYDSGDPDVLEYHLLLMRLAGIDGVIVDWYGRSDFRDYAILHRNTTRLLQQCERLQMRFVICYEDQTIPALVEAGRLHPADAVKHAAAEIDWLGQYWFQSGAYVRLQGDPVLLSFGHEGLTKAQWRDCLNSLSQPVAYFSQNVRRPGAVGAFDWPAPQAGIEEVDRFLNASRSMPTAIPVAFPRFHDIYKTAGVQAGYPRLPDRSGATFRMTLAKALAAKPPLVQLATWNDWGEGTQIEPSIEFGTRDLQVIQQQRRVRFEPTFPFRAADLSIPKRIYDLRQDKKTPKALVDAIVQRLVRGDHDAVYRTLQKLERR